MGTYKTAAASSQRCARCVNVSVIHAHPDIKQRAVCRAWRPRLFQVPPSDKILINFNPGPRTQVCRDWLQSLGRRFMSPCQRGWRLGVTSRLVPIERFDVSFGLFFFFWEAVIESAS